MTGLVYHLLTEQLWLEDAPLFCKDEYYCPQLAYISDLLCDNRASYYELEGWKLIFDEWEITQQEQFVGGLGNENVEKPSFCYEAYEKMAEFAKKYNVAILTAQQGDTNFQPRILDNTGKVI
jgi:hypothetical protein